MRMRMRMGMGMKGGWINQSLPAIVSFAAADETSSFHAF